MNDSTPVRWPGGELIHPSDEWGIFSDEGCIERQLHGHENIVDALTDHMRPDPEDGYVPEGVYAARLCPDHEEQPANTCQHCHAEEEIDHDAA